MASYHDWKHCRHSDDVLWFPSIPGRLHRSEIRDQCGILVESQSDIVGGTRAYIHGTGGGENVETEQLSEGQGDRVGCLLYRYIWTGNAFCERLSIWYS